MMAAFSANRVAMEYSGLEHHVANVNVEGSNPFARSI